MNKKYMTALCDAIKSLDAELFDLILNQIQACQSRNSSIFIIGNGGSASLAEHFATDWSKGVFETVNKQYKAISLVSNSSLITAISNDFSYDQVFSKQLLYAANKDDLLFAISGSGNSRNIIEGIRAAKALGMTTVGICGFGGGLLAEEVELALVVNSFDMQIVEDTFSAIGHAIFKSLSGIRVNSESRYSD